MADSSTASTSLAVFLVSIGVSASPTMVGVGFGLGLGLGLLVRAIKPQDDRVEAWLAPPAAVVMSFVGLLLYDWFGQWIAGFPVTIWMGVWGGASIPILRTFVRTTDKAPDVADEAIDIAVRKRGAKKWTS